MAKMVGKIAIDFVFMNQLLDGICIFFSECMNEEKRNELGNKPLKDILNKELFGGWPVLEGKKWSSSDFNVWDQVLKIYKAGYSDR